jgi:hypothetical protein
MPKKLINIEKIDNKNIKKQDDDFILSDESVVEIYDEKDNENININNIVKRGRGRPKKNIDDVVNLQPSIKKEPKISGRPTKKSIFAKQRQNILNRLNVILNFNIDNGIICVDNLLEEKATQLDELIEDVKLYFICSNWQFFIKIEDRLYLSLIKNIYKDMGFDIRIHTESTTINGILHRRKMFIIKNV